MPKTSDFSQQEGLISDLARRALNGDHTSFSSLMNMLKELDHPALYDIARGVAGTGVIQDVLIPLSNLVMGFPKPQVFGDSLMWNSANGRPHNSPHPAEIWFVNRYVAFFKGGQRHRDGTGPTVIDVSNKTIAYYNHGEPRTHSKGPFKVEQDNGHILLTYIMGGRMVGQKPSKDSLELDLGGEDERYEEPADEGATVIITRDFIDIEGLGKSEPGPDDLKNIAIWEKELFHWLSWGDDYVHNYLNKFK